MIHFAKVVDSKWDTDSGKNSLQRVVATIKVPLTSTRRTVWFGLMPNQWQAEDFIGSKGELRFLKDHGIVSIVPYMWANKPGANSDDVPAVRPINGGLQPTLRCAVEGGLQDNNYVDLPPWEFSIECDEIQLFSEWIAGDASTHWATVLQVLSQQP